MSISTQPLAPDVQIWGITEIAKTEKGIALLRQHLREIVEGAAFKGSHRSAQFLTYIVEHAMAGDLDRLKERAIGVELFGRVPSYDTGEDAIVRVTASDVRKRLLQHYGNFKNASELRISLPSGRYVPEISRCRNHEDIFKEKDQDIFSADSATSPQAVHSNSEKTVSASRNWKKWAIGIAALVVLNVFVLGLLQRSPEKPAHLLLSMLPWSALFSPSRPLQVIASDPNIEEIQRITHSSITLSDYANQRYLPQENTLSPEGLYFCKEILRGNKVATVDMVTIATVAGLAPDALSSVKVKGARDVRMPELETDGNLIFLGSPRSNPWTDLFNDVLDFQFEYDPKTGIESIRNVKPKAGESSMYIPTARGFATGQSFATISFLQNPGRNGRVLILAGANGEGTEAASELITNPQRWSSALQSCGVQASGPPRSFQLLLRLSTMAGSANNVQIDACHVLQSSH